MKIYLVILTIIVAATSIISKNMQDIPCFPGAEGGGAVSLGGRGGKIIQVTNLNNSGSGSLRAALEASGPRIVVFRQGGTINLDSDINVTNPFVTIAGQTAPGDGICIKGDKVDIHTHDVLMQYVRIRPGRKSNGDPVQCIFIRDGSYNIMVDHCSFSWATDENFTAYSVSDATFNITLSWSLICEGLSGSGHNDHAAASIFGSVSSADKFTNVSIHHNLMSHNQFRMPYVKIANAEIINNISYDWQHWCSWYKAGIDIDIIGNRYKLGASFGGESWQQDHGIIYCLTPGDNGDLGVPGDPTIYIEGNLDHKYQVDPDSDNWGMIEGVDKSFKKYGDISTSYRRAHRQSFSTYPVTVYHVNDADDLIFNHAGASRRLNENGEWIDTRDNVDARLINQYKNGAGGIINNPSDVGGWPLYTSGTPYIDSDKDGMPDSWERSNNLDPNDPHDIHYDADNDGFTNIEEFLNATNPGRANSIEIEETHRVKPIDNALYQNYPNPFNSETKIHYRISEAGPVTLEIYDLLGRQVTILHDDKKEAGIYTISFRSDELETGIYVYRLIAGSFVGRKKMLYVK